MFRNLTIIQRILIMTITGFALSAGLLAAYIHLALSDNVRGLMLREQQEKAEIIVDYSSKALAERTNLLQELMPFLHDGRQLIDQQAMAELLDGMVLVKQSFNGGLMVADSAGIGVGEAPSGSGRIGLDISRREHLRIASETRQPVITRPLIATHARRPSFFINVPIIADNNEVIGFLIGITFLEEDNFLIPRASLARFDEQFYILDPDNRIIVTAHDYSLAMQPIPDAGVNPVIDAALSGVPSGTVSDRDGTRLLYAGAVLPEMGWVVVKTYPEKIVLAPIEQLIRNILLAAFVLLFGYGLILLWQLVRMLLPLREAVEGIDAMATERRPFESLPVAGNDEVSKLVKAFNRLLSAREEQRQRLYLATSGTGIGIWDYAIATGHMIWDDNMYKLYAVPSASGSDLHQVWQSRVHPEDLAQVNRALQQTITEDIAFDSEFRIQLPDGKIRWIKANAISLRDTNGEAYRIIGTNRDISEQKRIEQLKNQFVSTVSHELRTPLTSISGALGLIAGGAVGSIPPQASELIAVAYKNSQRLGHLINDLLDMDKIAAGKMRFDMILQELLPIIEQAIESNQAYARQFNVEFCLLKPVEDILVRVDAQRLVQVLSNLLSNAVKFSPGGGQVDIAVINQAHQVRIEVRDQGPGVPQDFQERLFTKFSQADSSDTRSKGGTGLGLAISRELVERMGGRIGLVSVPGKGATFYFDLPAVNHQARCALPDGSRPNSEDRRILVVEDDSDVARLLATTLGQNGFQADIALTGAAAMELLDQHHYLAMTLDLQLPDRDGVSIIRQLRTNSATANLPIIVVAGDISAGQLALNGGFAAVDWLQKPIDRKLLVASLRRAISTGSQRPRILHVEDDEDTGKVIALVGAEVARFDQARTLAEARQSLASAAYDLVILDIGLPDGSGWELLPILKQLNPVPRIIVLSGQELTTAEQQLVDRALPKGTTSTRELLLMLEQLCKGD